MADNDGITALIAASGAGHVFVVRVLLMAGADKDLADNDGRMAVIVATRAGHVEVVSLLRD